MSKTFKKDSWFTEIIKRPIPIWQRYKDWNLPNNTCDYVRALLFSLFVRMTVLSTFGFIAFSLIFLDVTFGYSLFYNIFHGEFAGGFLGLSMDIFNENLMKLGLPYDPSFWITIIVGMFFVLQLSALVILAILFAVGFIFAICMFLNERTGIFTRIERTLDKGIRKVLFPSQSPPDDEVKEKEGRICQFIEYK